MDNLKSFGIAFLCFFGALFIVAVIFKIAENDQQKDKLRKSAKLQCLEAGYPNMHVEFGQYYCMRSVNGSDQIMRVEP